MNVLPQIAQSLIEGAVGYFVDEGMKAVKERQEFYEVLKKKTDHKPELESEIKLRLNKQRHNDLLSEEVKYCIINNTLINSRVDSKHLYFFVGPEYILTYSNSVASESRSKKFKEFLLVNFARFLFIGLLAIVLYILFILIKYLVSFFY